jgi:Helicase HerA, central domain
VPRSPLGELFGTLGEDHAQWWKPSHDRLIAASAGLLTAPGPRALEQATAELIGGELYEAVYEERAGLRFDMWAMDLVDRAVERVVDAAGRRSRDIGDALRERGVVLPEYSPRYHDIDAAPMADPLTQWYSERHGHEPDREAGRITTISAQGRLMSPAGEDYALRQQRENRPIPEDLRDQFLKYRVNIRILGVLRFRAGDKPPVFVPSHRRLPHVGAKVAFLSDELLQHVAGATADGQHAVELGFLTLGEFVYAGQDARVGDDERLQVRDPAVLPRFDILHLVSRRSFVFARAGFGKSNLVKLLFANLYGGARSCGREERRSRSTCRNGHL